MDYNSLGINDKMKILSEDVDLSQEVLIQNIEKSNRIMESDSNIIIITDFEDDLNPSYTLEELNQKYSDYLFLPSGYKQISNSYSLSIWHLTVQQMYHRMKAKLLKNKDLVAANDLEPSVIDKVLYQYEEEVKESVINNDYLNYQIKKIDSLLSHSTIYESAVTASIIDSNPYKGDYDYSSDIPGIVPFMTYDEYKDSNNTEDISTPIDYIMVKDQKKYYDVIHDLQNMIGTDKESIAIEQLLKLGWNPMVKITAESIKYAREKQCKWLNENEQLNIIDLSKYSTNITEKSDIELDQNIELEPIYIVLSYTGSLFGKIINKWTKSYYSHAGISLSATLSEIYSFNIYPEKSENGLVIESLDDYNDKYGDANIILMTIFVEPLAKKRLEKNLKWYLINQNNTKYSYQNIIRMVFNKEKNSTYSLQLVCSQFVDVILKMSNIYITDKPSNLVTPVDFMKTPDRVNIFVLFEGKKKNYDFRKVESQVLALKKNLELDRLNVIKPDIVIKKINENLIENFSLDCDDPDISNILREMRNYAKIKPDIVLNEIKSPIGFKKDGSLYVTAPKDLQAEYEEAHRLLYSYNETNIQGIKHELARLFYLNSIIEKKLKKIKKTDPHRKELIDLRARILNDFYTYMKLVTTIEKDFNFMEYIKSTDYYNKIIEIDDSTLKYSGSYIKKVLELILKKKPD